MLQVVLGLMSEMNRRELGALDPIRDLRVSSVEDLNSGRVQRCGKVAIESLDTKDIAT